MISVLVVDDEPKHRRGLCHMIQELRPDYRIYDAKDGREALQQINAHSVDIVITDIEMPIMNGLQFIENLGVRSRELRIVILSAYSRFEYAQKAINLGAFDYLLKPVAETNVEQLLSKIEDNLSNSRLFVMLDANQLANAVLQADKELVTELIEQAKSAGVRDGFPNPERFVYAFANVLLQVVSHLQEKVNDAELGLGLEAELKQCQDAGQLKDTACRRLHAMIDWIAGNKRPRNEKIVESCRAYIENHYAEVLSLGILAAKFHFNPSYFCLLFKNHTQTKVSEYIMQTRMRHAENLLRNSSKKVYEIAQLVGYQDVKYFIRLFRKAYGSAPDEYRHFTANR